MKRASRRRHFESGGDLTLAAMVDMMVNLLIFLLHMYGTDPSNGMAGEIQLAESRSVAPIRPEVVLVVALDAVIVDGQRVGALGDPDLADRVRAVLAAAAQDGRSAAASRGEPWSGELVLEVDKRVAWPELSALLQEAGAEGFHELRFLVSTVSGD